MPGELVRAAETIEQRVEDAEEAAEEAALQNKDNEPEPQPDHGQDLALGERIGALEEKSNQPPQDPRVDTLLERFEGLASRIGEALEDSVSEVEEVTPDIPEETASFVQQVEEAPKRVHGFLRRLW